MQKVILTGATTNPCGYSVRIEKLLRATKFLVKSLSETRMRELTTKHLNNLGIGQTVTYSSPQLSKL